MLTTCRLQNHAPPEKRPSQLHAGPEGEVFSVLEMWWICRHGRQFDLWSFDLACWSVLNSVAEDIVVPRECDTVLVRVRGVQAAGLGSELFLIELTCGWVQPRGDTDEMVGVRRQGSIWTLLWVEVWASRLPCDPSRLTAFSTSKDHAGPLVFQFSVPPSRLLCLESTRAYRDGVTGLEGARQMAYWDEALGNWNRFSKSSTLYIEPNCPLLLLRREDAFSIHSLVEALRYLEKQRGYPAPSVVDPTRLATPADRRTSQVSDTVYRYAVAPVTSQWSLLEPARSGREIVFSAREQPTCWNGVWVL